ncbi:hypothetical protein KKA95_03545 [Patescibacteria group bacterium]|nr:hypothetical protein [Patescibacteria group bacterium]
MNPSKILIAAATIILLSSVFSGCGQKAEEFTHEAAKTTSIQLLEQARQVTKEVSLGFETEAKGDQVTVKVLLDNPELKPIISVQTWLSYNPKVLKGDKIEVKTSPFTFTAPYANTFDEERGLVMIGRSNDEPIATKTIVVAEVVFDVIGEGAIMVDAYDYRTDLSGHTSANMMLEGWPYNILIKPESPALIIQN